MSNSQTMCDRCRDRYSDSKIIRGSYGYAHLCKRCRTLISPEKEHRGKL